ncbi:MAG TPA: hypothetical protein VGB55_10905 [Tepidisphaeraceae bacterium]
MQGNITPALTAALERHGHGVVQVSELGLEDAADLDALFKSIHQRQLDVITTERALVDWPISQTRKFDRAIVYLQLEGGDVEQDDAIDRLFARYKSPKPGQLYTVTGSRVKVRQLPGL